MRLWIIDPAHINNIALKNAWVEMCRKARSGCLMPRVTIISPNLLDVENAAIFLMLFLVVIAPKHGIAVKIVLFL